MGDSRRIEAWLALPIAKSTWRHEARETMRSVVRQHWDGATDEAHMKALLALVDAEYPFGERRMHPYKAWLTERVQLRDALGLGWQQLPPTDEDAAACDVARDLVELGRIDEARALLDEQAPRRLNVACPACGAKVGDTCTDVELVYVGYGNADEHDVPRVIPHESRVRLVHGPLFGGG